MPADNKTGGCANSLNTGAVYLLDYSNYPLYDYFVFMGDDHIPRTQGWDKAFIQALGQNTGIVYGDDLLQGANLPTAFGMSRDLVNELRGMTFPGCVHLFFDNFVKQLGLDLEYLKYLPDVIIEHLHTAIRQRRVYRGIGICIVQRQRGYYVCRQRRGLVGKIRPARETAKPAAALFYKRSKRTTKLLKVQSQDVVELILILPAVLHRTNRQRRNRWNNQLASDRKIGHYLRPSGRTSTRGTPNCH